VFQWHGFASDQRRPAFSCALRRRRRTEQLQQRRNKINMTQRLRDDSAARLSRSTHHAGDAHGFLKHNAFAKQLVRTEQIPMITGVDNEGVLAQSRVLDARQDRADASIDESDEAEIPLPDVAILLERQPEIKAADSSGPVSSRSALLPFARQPITQGNIFTERDRRARIDVYLLGRVLVVERAVIRRVGLDKRDHQQKWRTRVALD